MNDEDDLYMSDYMNEFVCACLCAGVTVRAWMYCIYKTSDF